MNWFKKNKNSNECKQEESIISKPPCNHKWRDFDWYIITDYKAKDDSKVGEFTAELIEPYVCCWCKKREDHVLSRIEATNIPYKEIDNQIKEWKTEYKEHIRGRAIIEDQIQDMQRSIDREYLDIVAACYPEKLGLTEQQKQKLHLVHASS